MRSAGDKKLAAVSAAAETLALGLPPLVVQADRLAASVSLGVHGRRRAGLGQDFWQFLRYHPGDDAAGIDWRQSAKSQHLYVREREGETAQSVWIWRDGSAGMHFASARREEKISRASLIALALSLLLIRGGERVALYGAGALPGNSNRTYWRMAHRLCDVASPGPALPPDVSLPRHAQFLWISDFLSPLPDVETAMLRLIQRGVQGRFVHIIDPAEEDFPFTGRVRFESPDGSGARIFGRAERAAEDYRQRFAARSAALADLARHYGWNYIRHRTDNPARTVLLALYADLNGELKGGASCRR